MEFNVQFLRCLFAFGLASLPAFATSYTFETINVPGATSTRPTGINDQGQIVGTYTDSQGTHGFLYSGGSFQTLKDAGADVLPIGINNTGQYVANSASGYLLYSNGSFTSINSVPYTGPGPWSSISFSSVVGINNNGQILVNTGGVYFGGEADAFLAVPLNLSSYSYLGGGDDIVATGFNDNGGIISYYVSFRGTNGYGPGGQILTPAQIDYNVNPTGLNNADEVVGYYATPTPFTPNAADNGFIYAGGTSTTFDYPNSYVTQLTGINNLGDILGSYGDDPNSQTTDSGFVAIPTQPSTATPEPEQSSLSALGLGCLALMLWRSKRACWVTMKHPTDVI